MTRASGTCSWASWRASSSLYYFLPILAELRSQPIDPGYLDYLERRSRAVLGRKSAVTAK